MMKDPNFTFEKMKKKSEAAANLCKWICATVTYNKIYTKVKPLMDTLAQCKADNAAAEASLKEVTLICDDLERAATLQESFLEATRESQVRLRLSIARHDCL